MAAEVSVGPMNIPLSRLLSATWAYWHGSRTADAVVLGAIRWPRLLVAAFAGAGLASTGAVLQALFRNPMADPAIIGVSGGGSLGAVFMIQIGAQAVSPWLVPFGAFAAGLAAVLVVYRLATVDGRTAIHSLLLSGVAVASLCSAVVTLLLSLAPLETMQQIMFWLMGGLDGSTWSHVLVVAVFVLFALIVYESQAHALDILSLGEEQAEGVGVNPQRVKQVTLVTAALAVGSCVSVTGVIGFVGLIVPHLMRLWMGPSQRLLIPASALGGAALVTAADIVARMALAPVELNIGVVTSCLGAPFFLYLLRRQYHREVQG
ncbi:MAG: iron ABC transporter permease [Alicyclobacillaceae bacterium]|nr:iron ABC transporter permease [Alicyclobacillaceae bacterium]